MAKHDSTDQTCREIYFKLLDIIPGLIAIDKPSRFEVCGYTDLGFEILQSAPKRLIIALSHYYCHTSGDWITGPNIGIAVYPELEHAEALTYRDLDCYKAVDDGGNRANTRCRRQLNVLLSQWLSTLISQGHRVSPVSSNNAQERVLDNAISS